MPMATHFTNGVLNGQRVNIVVSQSGLIESISPADASTTSTSDVAVVDLGGQLVVPPFAEPHAHLDKAFLADRVTNTTGDLMGAIHGLEAIRHSITFDDIVERACRAAQLLSRNGVTAVRTHADTTLSAGLTSVLALLEAKRRCSAFINIQVAALLEWPLTGPGSSERLALARSAIDAGVDVMAQHQDTTEPGLAADAKGAKWVGYNSDVKEAAPKAWLTAPTWNWGPYYAKTAKSVAGGTCPTDEYYGNMQDGMVTLASFGESVDAETQSLIEEKKAATIAGEFAPFTGPIKKQDGSAWLADGEKAELGFLLGDMVFFVEGVVGSAKG